MGKRLREPYKFSEFELNIPALWTRMQRLRKTKSPYGEVCDQVSSTASSCLSRGGDKASPEITVTQGRKMCSKSASDTESYTGTRGSHDYF